MPLGLRGSLFIQSGASLFERSQYSHVSTYLGRQHQTTASCWRHHRCRLRLWRRPGRPHPWDLNSSKYAVRVQDYTRYGAPCFAFCFRCLLTLFLRILAEQRHPPPCMHMLLICPFFISYSAMPTGRSVCSCTCRQIHDNLKPSI
jgi:hypothetical protein